MQINNYYSVLTPGVTGGDVSVSGNLLSITGMPTIDIREIQNCGSGHSIPPVAETLAIWSINTPATPTASANYGFLMQQLIPFINPAFPGVPIVPGTNSVSATVLHSVPSGGETEAVMTAALVKGVNAYNNPASGFQVTATDNSASITLTAKTGYPLLQISDLNVPPATWTITNYTPGVASVGTYNDLLRLGVAAADIAVGTTYGEVIFNYSQVESGGNDFPSLTFSWKLFINYSANTTNYTNFINALKTAIPNLLLS